VRRIANKVETAHALERTHGKCFFSSGKDDHPAAQRAVHLGAGVARAACETCIAGFGLKSHTYEAPKEDKQLNLWEKKP
jgi:hypothetical protein